MALWCLLPCVLTLAEGFYSMSRSNLRPVRARQGRILRACASDDADSGMEKSLEKMLLLESSLEAAVKEERYGDAASLRKELDDVLMDGQISVLRANLEFYEAFSSSSVDRMEALWLRREGPWVQCIHPGGEPLQGFDQVMQSWEAIFRSGAAPDSITPIDVRCALRGSHLAWVTCREVVSGNAGISATNIFEKVDGVWKMTHHQAGPCVR